MFKRRVKQTHTLTILLFVVIILSTLPNIYNLEIEGFSTSKLQISSLPVEITKNEDFISYGFKGLGTVTEPYIIEDLEIENEVELPGITIENTTKYFVIRNCYINNLETGIRITNIADETGIIHNNTIYECDNAIVVNKSNSLLIQSNLCNTSYYYGLSLFDSNDCTISHNIIYWSRLHGIYLNNNSDNNNIYRNFFVLNNCKIYHAHPYYAWPQASDNGQHNRWYDVDNFIGSYWEDWSEKGGYFLDGKSHSQDPFPYRDFDGDFLDDYMEFSFFGTSHLTSDTDQDYLTDREEIFTYSTNPRQNDSDLDGYLDGEEVFLGTDPLNINDHPGIQEASYFFILTIASISTSGLVTYAYNRSRRRRR